LNADTQWRLGFLKMNKAGGDTVESARRPDRINAQPSAPASGVRNEQVD
jgi:hypothetical protein